MKVTCPHCAVSNAVDESLADAEILCDECGMVFLVKPRPLPPPLPPATFQRSRAEPTFAMSAEMRDAFWNDARRAIPYAGAVAAFIVWVSTACLPPGPVVMVNYIAVIAFGICVTAMAQRRYGNSAFHSRAIGWGGGLLIIGLLVTWNRYDFWQERVKLESGGFVDNYYRRGSLKPFYQYVSAGITLEGYLSESGKKHGKWELINWQPFSHTQVYYWYGDEITEGEWHLRNK